MAVISESAAHKHACPFKSFEACLGSGCMAWVWHGRGWEENETSNLVETPDGPRPEGDPARPEGEGWRRYGAEFTRGYENSAKLKLPKATAQRWRRTCERTKGCCGRIQPPGGYFDEMPDEMVPF